MFFDGTTSAPLVREGKLRALAVTDTVRSPALPDVPTMGSRFSGRGSQLLVRHHHPGRHTRTGDQQAGGRVRQGHAQRDHGAEDQPMGITVLTGTPQAFAAHIASETERLGKIVKASGARAE